MNFQEWLAAVPHEISDDALWTVEAYRLALFAADIGWRDVTRLMKDRRTRGLSDQLYRSLGSVSANIAEGYSRGTGKDRARFYEYALGSARGSRDHYFKARHLFGQQVAEHRIRLQTGTIRLLLTMVPQQRSCSVREAEAEYGLGQNDLLTDIPLPT